MLCRLEERTKRYLALKALAHGYETGDFTGFFPKMAKDCRMDSFWVLTPNIGYKAITEYYHGKGMTLKRTESFPECNIVELVGTINPVKNATVEANGEIHKNAAVGLVYTSGKHCLLMEQKLKGKTIGVIVDISLDAKGLVKTINLTDPAFYKYEEAESLYIDVIAVQDSVENEDSHILLGYEIFPELYLFMSCTGIEFDENDDQQIPMEIWCSMLNAWKMFATTESFDCAFERLAGINYEKWSVENKQVLKRLSHSGKTIWDDRQKHMYFLDALYEWTEKYKETNNCIQTRGL